MFFFSFGVRVGVGVEKVIGSEFESAVGVVILPSFGVGVGVGVGQVQGLESESGVGVRRSGNFFTFEIEVGVESVRKPDSESYLFQFSSPSMSRIRTKVVVGVGSRSRIEKPTPDLGQDQFALRNPDNQVQIRQINGDGILQLVIFPSPLLKESSYDFRHFHFTISLFYYEKKPDIGPAQISEVSKFFDFIHNDTQIKKLAIKIKMSVLSQHRQSFWSVTIIYKIYE